MKRSFIMGNVLLVIGSLILSAGIIAAPISGLVTKEEFNGYHLVALGLGIALMVIGAIVLVLQYAISLTNAKMTKKDECCTEVKTEVKAEPETKAVEVKPAEVTVAAKPAAKKAPAKSAASKTATKPATTKPAAKTTTKKK